MDLITTADLDANTELHVLIRKLFTNIMNNTKRSECKLTDSAGCVILSGDDISSIIKKIFISETTSTVNVKYDIAAIEPEEVEFTGCCGRKRTIQKPLISHPYYGLQALCNIYANGTNIEAYPEVYTYITNDLKISLSYLYPGTTPDETATGTTTSPTINADAVQSLLQMLVAQQATSTSKV